MPRFKNLTSRMDQETGRTSRVCRPTDQPCAVAKSRHAGGGLDAAQMRLGGSSTHRRRLAGGTLPKPETLGFGLASRSASASSRLSRAFCLSRCFRPLRLVDPQPTEPLLPSVAGLLRHADCPARLQDGTASPRLHLSQRGLIRSAESCFPRGMGCPPWFPPPPARLAESGADEGGAGQGAGPRCTSLSGRLHRGSRARSGAGR